VAHHFPSFNSFVDDATGSTSDKLSVNQYWIAFGVWLATNLIYMFFATRQRGKPPAITQMVVSTLLFAVFIYTVGGPFKESNHYSATVATILLPVSLFIAGFIVPNPIPVQANIAAQ
jgi:hypothetical protein